MRRCTFVTGPRWLIAIALVVSIPWAASVRAGASGTFTLTDGMKVAREYFAATRLNNGQVLITGGLGIGNYQATAELYDPAKVTSHTATLLPDGTVLFAGGTASGHDIVQAEVYDPTVNTFSTAGDMKVSRALHTAVLLKTGQVLIAGGSIHGVQGGIADAELYDPKTGEFTATGSMTTPRIFHTETLLNSGDVLIAGGGLWGGTASGFIPLDSAELYHP
jgi:large repetitive protein